MNGLEHILVVGCSTGGSIAAPYIVPRILDKSNSVILVAHMWTTTINRELQNSGIDVIKRVDGTLPDISPGNVYLMAHGNIDNIMKQAVQRYGKLCSGVILSGAGNDGSKGVEYIKKVGGHVFVQKERIDEMNYFKKIFDIIFHPTIQLEFYADEMPLSAERAVKVDYAGPLPQLARKVREFLSVPKPSYGF